jgi:transcriptional regulator with XRE-family HTH domain
MDMRRLVGRNAKKFRLAKGLTQEEFAERSGFSQQYISDLERGVSRRPRRETVDLLSRALQLAPADQLLHLCAHGSRRTQRVGKGLGTLFRRRGFCQEQGTLNGSWRCYEHPSLRIRKNGIFQQMEAQFSGIKVKGLIIVADNQGDMGYKLFH